MGQKLPKELTEFKPKLGDRIEFFRPGFQHWGVYMGNDDIVHKTTDKKGFLRSHGPFKFFHKTGLVKRENIYDVAGKSLFRVNNDLDGKYEPRPSDDIVKEANEMVGQKCRYHVFGSNCEHFASKLRYGKKKSKQVRNGACSIGAVSAVAATGVYFAGSDEGEEGSETSDPVAPAGIGGPCPSTE